MKKNIASYILLGIGTGFLLWGVLDLYTLLSLKIPYLTEQSVISGSIIGAVLGSFIIGLEGYYHLNPKKVKSGVLMGFVFGAVGGGIGFLFVELLHQHSDIQESSHFNLTMLQRWIILGVFLGVAFSLREKRKAYTVRGMIAGVVGGIASGMISQLVIMVLGNSAWARGVVLILVGFVFTISFYYSFILGRKNWLKILNGSLVDFEFELTEKMHFLGSSLQDDVLIEPYRGVNHTHAKLEKTDSEYSLLDNDHFGRTYVNFRSVQDQVLKNGDIIKIGTALLQYCSSTPKSKYNKNYK